MLRTSYEPLEDFSIYRIDPEENTWLMRGDDLAVYNLRRIVALIDGNEVRRSIAYDGSHTFFYGIPLKMLEGIKFLRVSCRGNIWVRGNRSLGWLRDACCSRMREINRQRLLYGKDERRGSKGDGSFLRKIGYREDGILEGIFGKGL